MIPLLPYLVGVPATLLAALVLAAVAAFIGGGMVARITSRPFLRGAVRQLLLAAVAAGLTYTIGAMVGVGASPGLSLATRSRSRRDPRPRPPEADSSFRSASTIMVTSSSKPIAGCQPSSSRARDGSRTAGPPQPGG